ncbi:hypothetical protein HD599_003232 [Conyzicola lurida]|uniref:Uncharacterized protein n=1 Tax=Conyzicola lurida TaxID=1172621 RepID=A0A841AU27_9MICO|nr:hypothetical protein [Conyzicola lurida]MBB5844909.1 hypothetical protein [Conyzicola lurida]
MSDDNQTEPVMSNEPRSELIKGRWFGLLSIVAAVASFTPSLRIVMLPVIILLVIVGLQGGPLARGLSVFGLLIGLISAAITFIPFWTPLL